MCITRGVKHSHTVLVSIFEMVDIGKIMACFHIDPYPPLFMDCLYQRGVSTSSMAYLLSILRSVESVRAADFLTALTFAETWSLTRTDGRYRGAERRPGDCFFPSSRSAGSHLSMERDILGPNVRWVFLGTPPTHTRSIPHFPYSSV